MKEVIERLCKYLIMSSKKEINITEIEELFHYNRAYLMRSFKEYTGYTIIEYVNMVRVYKTIDPLVYTDDTILKISLNNGFNSQEYYSEKFKDVIGISPLSFRKEYSLINKSINELKEKRESLLNLKNKEKELINIKIYKKTA